MSITRPVTRSVTRPVTRAVTAGIGGALIPANTIYTRAGSPIVDRAGNYIEVR